MQPSTLTARSAVITFLLVQAVLSTVAVVLRFVARRMKGTKLWWDDWLVIPALLFFWAYAGTGVGGITDDFLTICIVLLTFTVAVSSLAKPPKKLTAEEYKKLVQVRVSVALPGYILILRQVSFALVVFMNLTITTARLSVVLLYYRIFSISKRFKAALWVMGITTVLWCIILDGVIIFQCRPVSALFDPRKGRLCLNSQLIFLISEVFNCLLDIILVVMPIPLIRKLYLPLKDKIAISVLFLLGGL